MHQILPSSLRIVAHTNARRTGVLAAAVLLILSAGPAYGDTASAALDSALAKARARDRVPAATASIHRCGRPVWNGASGVRRLGSRARVTPGTRFVIASVTKPVVATMVLQMVDAGRLDLDAPVGPLEPGIPNADRITPRQLLGHTSGLPEYSPRGELEARTERSPRHRFTRAEVLRTVPAPRSAPGGGYAYRNTNYIALGGVLERIGGGGIEDQFRKRIAGPAGMSAMSSFTYRPRAARRFAEAYDVEADGTRTSTWRRGAGLTSDMWGPVWTDGGLASTAPDVANFTDALFAGRLLSPARLAEMIAPGKGDYGLGIYDQDFGGRTWTGHDGSYGGYEAETWHDRSRGLTVTLLASASEPDSDTDTNSARIWRALVRAYDASAAGRAPGACDAGSGAR